MIWFETKGTIWKVEDKGSYARINFSTSRKDKQTGEYQNSSWFANAVGNAYEFVQNVERGDFVHMKGCISNERYEDAYGNLQNRKTPNIMIYEMYYFEDKGAYMDNPPRVVTETEVKSNKSAKQSGNKTLKSQPPNEDDDLPF
ncbi:MAG: hypothetical protein KBG38_07595 [Candidatus Cloacimonas sp.]|nr:hypothetical protein [Candidatus Cloacimonas sp.]